MTLSPITGVSFVVVADVHYNWNASDVLNETRFMCDTEEHAIDLATHLAEPTDLAQYSAIRIARVSYTEIPDVLPPLPARVPLDDYLNHAPLF